MVEAEPCEECDIPAIDQVDCDVLQVKGRADTEVIAKANWGRKRVRTKLELSMVEWIKIQINRLLIFLGFQPRYFYGRITEVKVWEGVKSKREIEEHYLKAEPSLDVTEDMLIEAWFNGTKFEGVIKGKMIGYAVVHEKRGWTRVCKTREKAENVRRAMAGRANEYVVVEVEMIAEKAKLVEE